MAYWDLTGLRVSVDASPGDKVIPIKTSVDRKAGDYLPLPGMYGDVSWIPEMARLTESGKGRIEKASFAADPGSAKVAARTHFGSGQLTAAFRKRDMGLGYDEVEFEFEPQPKSGPYRQALAAARLIQQLTSGSVTFKLQRFGPGTMPKPVVLRVPATNGGPLEVGLTNESVKPGGAGTCKNNDDVQILKHFKAYYDLLDPMDRVDDEDKRPIPRAVGATTPKCGAGNEIIWCPPMMFSKPGRTA
jgi:hypothetical protein